MTATYGLSPGPDAAWWSGLLDPDETLLWTGAPAGPPPRGASDWRMTVFGLFFGGFAAVWILLAGFPFGLFGLLHFAAGMFIAFGLRWMTVRRFATARYALTDRRAMVAVGARVTSWPISPEMTLQVEASDPGSIFFEPEEQLQGRHGRGGSPIRKLRGFEMIAEARDVYRAVRRMQTERAG